MENEMIYLRLRQKKKVPPNKELLIGDIAQLIGEDKNCAKVEKIPIYQVTKEDKNLVVIDVMKVITAIQKVMNHIEVQVVGPTQTIVEVQYPKKKLAPVYFVFIWFLLFIGAALAIMNFHEDVSMREVHQQIYKIVTGIDNPKPLLLQVPYSFGLGIGMVLFFNHLFKKRFNEEPSPLEVEMFNYQQDLDQYVIVHENDENGHNKP
ncbi:stage V sporulation protein AA [Bacillus hwajinpoensis]|uniref:Stage V sporulation protein AA n=1 Tax=Guptibacillus hwajinpoensis TaxID=208199 RepID=A0A845EXL6_9BACL|nr:MULTISPECIES: stage V sporulation protein AA [Bacillaceae]MYL63301.1 stage V sporulation protein AA [Pseudalkalibacillus hwajinpoensis]PFG13695.1 stage V sporulation protein AA [Bacillus sp. es.036]